MSSLWTPSGEHRPEQSDASVDAAAQPSEADREAVEAELRRVRAELANTPVAALIANHAIGLWQLAVLHLTPEEGQPVRLDEASLAIDAMAALVEGLGGRLGEHEQALRDALAQLRVAFVQVSERVSNAEPRSGEEGGGESSGDD